jgi:PAS domain S-box-containing protein
VKASEEELRQTFEHVIEVNDRVKESEEKYRLISESMSDLVCLQNHEGRYTYVSQSVFHLLGYTSQELTGQPMHQLVHPDDQPVTEVFVDAAWHGASSPLPYIQLRLRHRDGSYIWFGMIAKPIPDDAGQAESAHTTCRNITERKIAKETLKQTPDELKQRNVELDHYVYKVSHDLRSPLSSIKGLLSLSYEETDLQTVLNYNRMIEERIGRSDEFIMSILNHSKMLNFGPENSRIDFEAILKESFEDLQYMKHFSRLLRQVSITHKAEFYSDPFRISLIFKSLLSNAVKFQNLSPPQSYVRFQIEADENQARITVSDNGIGIEQLFQPRIFEMFFRATEKSEGSGLGLYIVKQAIERIGGSVSITSQPDEGTQFVISLPNSRVVRNPETTGV